MNCENRRKNEEEDLSVLEKKAEDREKRTSEEKGEWSWRVNEEKKKELMKK